MTENKRFKLKYINEQHISANLYDNKTFIGSIGIGAELIVELLNTLSEENEQLKDGLNQRTDQCDKYYKENEQLKQEYQKLKHRHSLLHDVCLDVECDRDRYHNDVLSLEKENEQLKTLLKAYQKSVEDYKYQIRKGVKENLTMLELADNCGVDVE